MLYQEALTELSGIRFTVTYSFFGDEQEARESAKGTCVEQTIEFPPELLPDNAYWRAFSGRVESFEKQEEQRYIARISYAMETTSSDIVQILNVIYGNIAQIRGIRVEDVEFPSEMLTPFKGPRFGREGVRELCGVTDRSLICATLKPMGLTSDCYADMCYQFALGGSDLIKDDHGIMDQSFARFDERVEKCAQAVLKANAESGETCLYAANVSGPADEIMRRALYAKSVGASALLVLPGLIGWDMVRLLRENDELALPIIVHRGRFPACISRVFRPVFREWLRFRSSHGL